MAVNACLIPFRFELARDISNLFLVIGCLSPPSIWRSDHKFSFLVDVYSHRSLEPCPHGSLNVGVTAVFLVRKGLKPPHMPKRLRLLSPYYS